MATSTQEVVSDGTLVLLDISINYIDRSEITVFYDNIPAGALTWSWVGLTEKRIAFSPAIANGVVVKLKRTTNITKLRHEFSLGAAFTADTLDEDLNQVLHIAQEAAETVLSGSFTSDVIMNGNKIVGVAPGVASTDAATVGQIAPFASAASASATLAQRWATEAEDVQVSSGLFSAKHWAAKSQAYVGSLAVASGADLVGFTQGGVGASNRTVQSKAREVLSGKDFGAVGNGVADDTAAILKVKAAADGQRNAVVNLGGGKYVTTAPIWTNHVSPTSMQFDKPAVLGLFEGTDADPDTTTNDPVLWVQKYTKYDNGTDRFAHNPGALFGEVIIKGTGIAGGNDTDATWIGCLGNVVQQGVNQGSAASPDYDAYGNVVGIAGFARINGYPGAGNIACGVWAYTSGPQMDSATWGNLPNTNWSVVGVEANIELNHPDIGEKAVLAGKGASVGYLAYNYRAPAAGVRDWTFGLALTGSPNDGNFASPDVNNWSGFYTGLLIDKIKAKGIRFGQYFKTGSYGIYFPDSYVGTQEPLAAIYLGNSKINLGQYVGSTFNNNDLWHNGGGLFFRTGGVSGRALVSLASTVTLQAGTTSFSSAGNIAFGMGSVASAVNAMTAFGAATGGAPALAATGSDTNIDLELRPKGTGRVWVGAWTSNGDAAVNGYITVKDSTGVIRKLATIV